MRLSILVLFASWAIQVCTNSVGSAESLRPYKRAALQSIVTWDKNSLFIHGKRVVIYSGEFHPFRLPSPGLWLDVFQKMRAMGYNAASVYFDWALLEGQQGHFLANGVHDINLFLQVAKQAGVYIIARPGPYINAEASGGGFPGWLQRNPAHLRTNETGFLQATYNYINSTCKIIAANQITNGGAVILVQPENEYLNGFAAGYSANKYYVQDVENQFRDAGIVMPFTNNYGPNHFQPGTGIGAIDLYGQDIYPAGFYCGSPYSWTSSSVPDYLYDSLRKQSSTTPPMIPEYQGGSFDAWGGTGFDKCASLFNGQWERCFYKNNFASGLKIVSYYMTYGGTNWGNLGEPQGYTSYDYGGAIKENREITREKYHEAKLIANFWQVSPAYLTASPGARSSSYSTATTLTVTPVLDASSKTAFYVIRHSGSDVTTTYQLKVSTSAGSVSIPQIQGSLSLIAKDSKIHVTDYAIGSYNVLYSSAEIFTHQTYSTYSIVVLYGGDGEVHETAFSGAPAAKVLSGTGVTIKQINGATVFNWQTSSSRKIVQIGADLFAYLIDRNSAYNYWVAYLPGTSSDVFGTFSTASPVVINGGYLVRNATITGTSLYVQGDLNSSTTIEVIGAPSAVSSLYFNSELISTSVATAPVLSGQLTYTAPTLNLPNLGTLAWKYINSLPELASTYDDSLWTSATNTRTNNTNRPNLSTPTSLYGADYGYNTGSLLYRGHFTSAGSETSFSVTHEGGEGYAASVWLGSVHLGSYAGAAGTNSKSVTYNLPTLTSGKAYIITVLIDQNGFEESQTQGADGMKAPRGILTYTLTNRAQNVVSWKVTGNLHGESYVDKARGPLNEGGMYAERQGFHLPAPPSSGWSSGSPLTGTSAPGVAFYASSFTLNLPTGYDIPIYVNFPSPSKSQNYRCQLFINGWQFGKYVSNLGPQTAFPVPEGILNYQGLNYISLTLWSQDASGNKLSSLGLSTSTPIQSGYGAVALVDSPPYAARAGAY